MATQVYPITDMEAYKKAGPQDLMELLPAAGSNKLYIKKWILEAIGYGIAHCEFIHAPYRARLAVRARRADPRADGDLLRRLRRGRPPDHLVALRLVGSRLVSDRLVLMIDLERCTGCKSCEAACKQEHRLGPGEYRNKVVWSVGAEQPALSFLTLTCQQ